MLSFAGAAASSEYSAALGAAAPLEARLFCSAKGDAQPWWLGAFAQPCIVTDVELVGDVRPEALQEVWESTFEGLRVELLGADGRIVWASPTLGAEGSRPLAVVTIPAGRVATQCRILRHPTTGSTRLYLSLSQVRCFGRACGRCVLLARHGQAQHNVGAAFCPVLGPALTPQGQAEAQQLGALVAGLPAAAVLCVSPQLRALETAALARRAAPALARLPVRVLPEAYEHAWWREQGAQLPPRGAAWPEWVAADVALLAAAREALPAEPHLAPNEDPAAARARAARLLEALRKEAGTVLLVAHGGVNQDLLQALDPRCCSVVQLCQRNGEVIATGLD